MSDLESIIGVTAGVLSIICFAMLVYSAIKMQKNDDVELSIFIHIVLFTAEILWCIYGIVKNDIFIIITYGVIGAITLIIIFSKIIKQFLYKTLDIETIELTHRSDS